MGRIKARVGSVLDGNTLELGMGEYPDSTGYTAILARVYAPPLTRKEGREAKLTLTVFVNGKHITHQIVGTGVRDMPLVEVWLDDINVNDWMIEKGYGKDIDWPIEPDWKVK